MNKKRNYYFVNYVDPDTTKDAKFLQTKEMVNLLRDTLNEYVNLGRFSRFDFTDKNKIRFFNENFEVSVRVISREVNLLTLQDVIQLNQDAQSLFEEDGIYGVSGLKDRGIVETALNNIGKNSVVFGQDQFPTISKKAAHLWFKLARYQAFNNGNKRTALIATLNFLENNNYYIDYKKLNLDRNYFYKVSKLIANDKWDEQDIQTFLLKVCGLGIRRNSDGRQIIGKSNSKLIFR